MRALSRATIAVALLGSGLPGCSETSGPAVAVTLRLVSVDGGFLPREFRATNGRPATINAGRLQGTNWGHACGFALQLAEGPVSATDVPDCRLRPGEERTFTFTFTDSRFPSGSHAYRFIP